MFQKGLLNQYSPGKDAMLQRLHFASRKRSTSTNLCRLWNRRTRMKDGASKLLDYHYVLKKSKLFDPPGTRVCS